MWHRTLFFSLEEYVQRRVCFVNVQSPLHLNFVFFSLEECVQRRVCFVNVQSSLHLNVVFSLCCVRMGNAACIVFIMWNSISGLEAWYHFRFNISCGLAVTVRSHQEKFQVIFQGVVRGAKKPKKLERRANFHF